MYKGVQKRGRQAFRVLDKSFAAQIADFLADPARVAKRHKPSVDVAHIGAADAGSVYDDREFYVELLRGVVLAGAGGVLDEASKWKEAEAVALRRKQALKRKDVERRASKGRKTRYVPIPKLQNFMAPRVPEEAGEVDEELVDNLLRTLFR